MTTPPKTVDELADAFVILATQAGLADQIGLILVVDKAGHAEYRTQVQPEQVTAWLIEAAAGEQKDLLDGVNGYEPMVP